MKPSIVVYVMGKDFNLFNYRFFFFLSFFGCASWLEEILVPWPGIEPRPKSVKTEFPGPAGNAVEFSTKEESFQKNRKDTFPADINNWNLLQGFSNDKIII